MRPRSRTRWRNSSQSPHIRRSRNADASRYRWPAERRRARRHERLAAEPYRSALPWEDVLAFFGDERCVPPEDAQSNYRMAREAFLNAVNIPERNVYRIRGEDPPEQAAASYAADLKRVLGDRPRFDLVLLGMGADGHTASLFPGTDPTADSDRLVRAVYSASVQMWRITLTPSVLNAARCVTFAVEGSAKSTALAAVRNGADDASTYPAQIIAPTDGRFGSGSSTQLPPPGLPNAR